MRRSLAWLLVPAVALGALIPATRHRAAVVVVGAVFEEYGAHAIPGATVRAGDATATSDSAGRFILTATRRAGDTTIAVSAAAKGFVAETLAARLDGDTARAFFRLGGDTAEGVAVTFMEGPLSVSAARPAAPGPVVPAQGSPRPGRPGSRVETYNSAAVGDAFGRGSGAKVVLGNGQGGPGGGTGDLSGILRRSDGGACEARTQCERSNTEEYRGIVENPFVSARSESRSTFSVDVDRASYGVTRRFVDEGELPPRDAVRVEELVNYFPYAYPSPSGRDPIAVTATMMPAPWRPEHRLVRIAMQAKRIEERELPPSNLVFLIDVSGSMDEPNKLPLVQQSLRLLVERLRPVDRVAIVVYAGNAGLVLPSTPGDQKTRILDAIERLSAGGSTAGGAGIRLAYQVAKENFLAKGNNRVILATDGDFNVGPSSDAELERLIEEKRAEGTFLTVLGFGEGNYQDAKMEALADKGNGNYAYVDDLMEARKTLVQEMSGTLVTVAKDVKLQVEFNPARVRAWRLIGYENRLLRDEDFTDDRKDAGEVGAGHSVTALYEIVPVGATTDVEIRERAPLRYEQPAAPNTRATASDELLHVAARYKAPDGDTSVAIETVLHDGVMTQDDDFTFAAAVASFGMLLRESPHAGRATMEDVIAAAERSKGKDELGYRADFLRVARTAGELVQKRVVKR